VVASRWARRYLYIKVFLQSKSSWHHCRNGPRSNGPAPGKMRPMIKGILWDNDGVLVDTEQLFYEANRELFREFGVELSPQQFFDWYLADNCGAWHLLTEHALTEAQIEAHRARRNVRHSVALDACTDLAVAGMDAGLTRLAELLPMGIVTSSTREHFDLVHGKLDLLQHFAFVIAAGDYVHSKPSPEPYLLGLRRLGLAAADCIAIEDSPRGLTAARAAGLRCIVIRSALTRHHHFNGAYKIVDHPAELFAVIDTLL
jgi:beta-phosphoglucomutase-like phosphatase (HAD superfamily)